MQAAAAALPCPGHLLGGVIPPPRQPAILLLSPVCLLQNSIAGVSPSKASSHWLLSLSLQHVWLLSLWRHSSSLFFANSPPFAACAIVFLSINLLLASILICVTHPAALGSSTLWEASCETM